MHCHLHQADWSFHLTNEEKIQQSLPHLYLLHTLLHLYPTAPHTCLLQISSLLHSIVFVPPVTSCTCCTPCYTCIRLYPIPTCCKSAVYCIQQSLLHLYSAVPATVCYTCTLYLLQLLYPCIFSCLGNTSALLYLLLSQLHLYSAATIPDTCNNFSSLVLCCTCYCPIYTCTLQPLYLTPATTSFS